MTVKHQDGYVWPGMSWDDFGRIGEYLCNMRDTLGQSRYLLQLLHDPTPPEDRSSADVFVAPGYMSAEIRLCRDFLDIELRLRRHTLIHEICHLFVEPLKAIAGWNGPLPDVLGKPAFAVWFDPFNQNIERAVDNMAFVMGELVDDTKDLHLLCRGGRANVAERNYINQLKER
jgi:hypothetical protein